jgi:hypothetical protein
MPTDSKDVFKSKILWTNKAINILQSATYNPRKLPKRGQHMQKQPLSSLVTQKKHGDKILKNQS